MVLSGRIAMVTVVTPQFAAYEASVQNKLDYCAVHGHDLIIERAVLDLSRQPVWTKLHVVRRCLADYDWIFWSDADAVVTDFSRSLGQVLGQAEGCHDGTDLYVTADPRGMNFGHFFLRNSRRAFDLIDAALARTDTLDHGCQEQEAVVRVLRETPGLCAARYVPQRLFNSYPDEMGDGPDASWQTGDFICHCPGAGKHLFPTLLSRPSVQIHTRDDLGGLFERLGYRRQGAEVGVGSGEFAQVLRRTWPAGHIHLVDRWRHAPDYCDLLNAPEEVQEARYQEVRSRFAGDPAIVIHRAESTAAAARFDDGSFDWVYIDADHSYEAVSADLRAWWPKLRVGGLLGGHDFVPDGDRPEGRFGVKRAVLEFLTTVEARRTPYRTSEPDWPSWYVIKRRQTTFPCHAPAKFST